MRSAWTVGGMLLALLTAPAGHGRAQQPVTVSGRVLSETPEGPLVAGALVELLVGDAVMARTRTNDGQFRLTFTPKTGPAAPLVLRASALGYERRLDTLDAGSGGSLLDYRIVLATFPICFGICPPDSAAAAAAWARRDAWGCVRDAEGEPSRPAMMLKVLANPDTRRRAQLRHPARDDAARLRLIQDDAVCRRVGLALVQARSEGTAATAFLVYRIGDVWLVQAQGEEIGAVLGPDLTQRTGWIIIP